MLLRAPWARWVLRAGLTIGFASAAQPGAVLAQPARPADLLDLTIEELGNIQVISASGRPETVSDAAASVYVITREDIRRSGATSIPEALRLAPGVEVARNGAHEWTITLRGFNDNLSDKLLVMIDGRSVYTPLYGGVFWDAQDVLMEDIQRIEVIAGPGGTVWGANAVNGVINIITRSARDTQGGFAEIGAGDEDDLVAGVRYGRRFGDLAARGYVKRTERNAARTLDHASAGDDWHRNQGGFRLDWALGGTDSLTVQADAYDAEESARVRSDFTLGTLPGTVPGSIDVSGRNLLARWVRQFDAGAQLRVQGYYDHTERDIPGSFDEDRDTVDLEVTHDLRDIGRHDLIWGADFRVTSDDLNGTLFASFVPDSRTDRLYSVFLEDRIDLHEGKLFLTLGSKLEHNDYTGYENQPNVRLAWLPTPRQTVWAAVSRAVRIPTRVNRNVELHAPIGLVGNGIPLFAEVDGDPDFESEQLTAYELGYRTHVGDVSVDAVAYYHDYGRLLTNEVVSGPVVVTGPPAYLLVSIVEANGMRGETYGGTLDVKWQPRPFWRLEAEVSHIDFDLSLRPGSGDRGATLVAGNSPDYQGAIRSYLQLPRGIGLYFGVRYVDELKNQDVPSYVAVDANIIWQITPRLEASLTARNLTDPRHPEFGDGEQIERNFLVKLDWDF